jgi:hypothetical protein
MSTLDAGDQLAIAQVLQLYFAAIDRKDFARLAEVFTPDAELRYSLDETVGPAVGPAFMIDRIREFTAAFVSTQHLGSAPLIEADAAGARARTNLRALHVRQHDDGRRSTWVVYGVYEDVLVRSEAGWQISRRVFRVLHQEGEPQGVA